MQRKLEIAPPTRARDTLPDSSRSIPDWPIDNPPKPYPQQRQDDAQKYHPSYERFKEKATPAPAPKNDWREILLAEKMQEQQTTKETKDEGNQ